MRGALVSDINATPAPSRENGNPDLPAKPVPTANSKRINILTDTSAPKAREVTPNSLFRNILRVSHLESIFCAPKIAPRQCNPRRINILAPLISKNILRQIPSCSPLRRSNSLFRNILHISPIESRFCAPQIAGPSINSSRINILQKSPEKLMSSPPGQPSRRPRPCDCTGLQHDRPNWVVYNLFPYRELQRTAICHSTRTSTNCAARN